MNNENLNTHPGSPEGNVNKSCHTKRTVLCIVLAVLSVLVIVLPFLSAVLLAVNLPPMYSDIYHAALNEKYDRLHSIEGRKIVVVGGSSVAFGIDSEKLEEYTGLPVVNFGLYADLGTKIMLDLSRSGINEGDIVIISPELDPQTLSLYFNSKTALQALDDDMSMFFELPFDDQVSCLAGMWSFLSDKWQRLSSPAEPTDSTDEVYRSKYFDEYGDFDYPRAENVLFPTYYDISKPVDLSPQMLYSNPDFDFESFADYLNGYISDLEERGADVYFSWCPINSLSVTSSESDAAELSKYLQSRINCRFISELDSYILDPGYFFDTNFHLNDSGVQYRTLMLAWDLKFERDDMLQLIPDMSEAPTPPELPYADTAYSGYDENYVYFTYEYDQASRAYFISGLTELGKEQKELILPVGYEGRAVIMVKAEAFRDSTVLEKIVITAESNITMFENGAFLGASSVRELWIYKGPDDIMPPADFVGVADGFSLHVPEDSGYKYHYYWSERGIKTFVEDAN